MQRVSEPELAGRECRRCRGSFTTRVLRFPKTQRAFVSCICPACETPQEKATAVQVAEASRLEAVAAAIVGHEAALALWSKLCPPLFQDTAPARLPQAELEQVLTWQYGPQGLLLMGPTDVGKSRAVFLLLKRLILEDGLQAAAFDAVGFDHECVRAFRAGRGEDWADELAKVDVLLLDDAGKGAFTPRVEMELFGLVDRRTTGMVPLLVTTNMTGDELAARATQDRGAPLVRRLREFCQVIVFPDPRRSL